MAWLHNQIISEKENTPIFDSSSNNSTGNSSSSGVAQVAAAIRARRARIPDTNSNIKDSRQRVVTTQPRSSSTNVHSGNSTSGSRIKLQPYLNAENLLAAYLKGRRDFASHNLSLLKSSWRRSI